MTVLFPIVAAMVGGRRALKGVRSPRPRRIAILIPAHNEEFSLPATLTSIREAIEEARKDWECQFRVVVGIDGCTDNTERVVSDLGTEILRMPSKTGKWGTISALVEHCAESEWSILADSGVSWPKDFLLRVEPFLTKADTMGVAPTYRNHTSGLLERLTWSVEGLMKRIESRSGGPVSVHGATVCYRTKELALVLRRLSPYHWLNDDVVIPLCLRALYPARRLEYVHWLAVSEAPKATIRERSEFRRRRRLVMGNIQWIAFLWGTIWQRNSVAAILACRRVFRLLWAYWAGFGVLVAAYCVGVFSLPTPVVVCVAGMVVLALSRCAPIRPLLESSLASVLAPYYFVTTSTRGPISSQETLWN